MSPQEETRALELIKTAEVSFQELAEIHGAVNFRQEASFAMEAMKKNSYLLSVALKNPDSLKRAVVNVAAVGLSLSPIHKLAYLIPRKSEVCLDISYQGLVAVACEEGAIEWALAEIVYEKDTYRSMGMGKRPQHEFDPFSSDRGEIKGAYCVAKIDEDEYITIEMPIHEIHAIRDRSESWKAHVSKGTACPWSTDPGEMIKKTVIRRASKSWPRPKKSVRLERAMYESDQADPIDVISEAESTPSRKSDELKEIRSALTQLNREESQLVEHLSKVHSREIESLEDLTTSERAQTLVFLNQLLGGAV